jgi:hypothetical protein
MFHVMKTQTNPGQTATARIIHGSLIVGVVLFAIIVGLVVRPKRPDLSVPLNVAYALSGVSLAASLVPFFLRRFVPRRNTTDSADLYWSNALPRAMVFWAPFEMAGVLGVVAYMLSGSPYGLGAAAIGVLGLLAFGPWHLERA